MLCSSSDGDGARQLADGDWIAGRRRRMLRTASSEPRELARQPQHDRDVLPRLRIVQQAGRHAGAGHARPPTRSARRDSPAAAAFSPSTSSRQLRLRRFDVPVDVDDAGRLLERRIAPSGRARVAASGVRAVHLGHERLQHRRTRRHLDDLNAARPGARAIGIEPRAEPLRDGVALLASGRPCRPASPAGRPGSARAAGSSAARGR